VAELVEGVSARMVGYAMAALSSETDVPWQRVINRKGEISRRKGGVGELIQRRLLEYEGIGFDRQGRIDLATYRWQEGKSKSQNTSTKKQTNVKHQ
jgi:methylated-DNA-protein-cysteine methyltransferase-like protein